MKNNNLTDKQKLIAVVVRTRKLKGLSRFQTIEKLSMRNLSHRYLKALCSQVDNVIDTLSKLRLLRQNFEVNLVDSFLNDNNIDERDLL